ncbi:clarin-3 [Talpa occidentalis]|uniref:clarin-3 n=1 Tax=Talpa occidentalis TaxID=50954 RepID=UPI00188E5AC6|nr:clarin-3 [Talpa occidentalis]
MPTTRKTLMFLSSFALSLASLVMICYVLGTQGWVRSTVSVSDHSSNGSIIVTYGLFGGLSNQQLSHGIGQDDKEFKVLDLLSTSSTKTLHSVVILTLALSLLTSLLCSGFTFYNSVSNPYQTFLGPVGVYTWSGLGAFFTLLTMILFVANTQSNRLSEALVETLYSFYPASTHRGTTHSYGVSFWLLLLIICLDIGASVIIVFYQKARHQRKQEQRKPMEHAPRDGILF